MAQIRKRGRGWQATVRVDNRERTKTFRLKVDAERWADTMSADIARGQWVDPRDGRQTFEAVAERWRLAQPHRKATRIGVEVNLRRAYAVVGDRPISAIRTSDLQAMVTGWSQTLAPRTVANGWANVVSVFRAAVSDRLVASSPCVGVKLPSPPAQRVEVLTVDQVDTLAAAVPDRYRAVVIAGAGLGLRPGEICGLRVEDVDFLRRVVHVRQQTNGEPLKTAASRRDVPLPTWVAEALAAHLAAFPSDGPVFVTEHGTSLTPKHWDRVWIRTRARCGAPTWATPHSLRHHYASALIAAGLSVKVVQTRLGHASAAVTLNTYAHLWADDEDRTREAIDNLRGPSRGHPADTRTAR
jgi:integrase